MDVSVEVHCATCGSANYGLPQGSGDAAVILCNDCGSRLGDVAELKAELFEQALARSAEALRRALDDLESGAA